MLHLRRDQLKIGIARDQIELVRLTGWLKPRVVAHSVETITTNVLNDNSDDCKYAALLAHLSEISGQEKWQNVDVTLLLSSEMTRYLSFPKHAAIRQAQELKAFAQHQFVHIYGEAANSWIIKVNICKTGENIASAVESSFIDDLREIFSGKQQTLISIQPALMASFNLHKKELQNKDCWFVFSENGYFTYALIGDGQWQYVQTRRGMSIDNLLQWLERENLSGLLSVPCYEIWHIGPGKIDVEDSPFKLHALKTYSCMDIDAEQYGLALYGGC